MHLSRTGGTDLFLHENATGIIEGNACQEGKKNKNLYCHFCTELQKKIDII